MTARIRRLRARAMEVRPVRLARTTRSLRFLLPRHPRLLLRLAVAEVDGSSDASLIPLLDRAIAIRPTRRLIRRRALALSTAGELTEAADAWRSLERRGDRKAATRVRMLEGRLRETDPTWLPRLDQPPERIEPASPVRVLHILKSSAPERWSGFTIRTLENLRAQRAAGLDPVVVTEIGWPRVAGVTNVAPELEVSGFRHLRLDRGAGYEPTSVPNDLRLQDNLLAMADAVRDVRPAILHAHSGYRGGEHALIALGLRETFGIPVVYEVRGLFEAVWSPDPVLAERSEQYRRRLAMETRILHEVDGVLAISEVLADELVGRGIPRSRITIIPNGIDPDALGSPDRDAELRLSLGLDARFVVGYLGNLDHWREGIDVLIGALAELKRRGRHDIAGLVVGDGQRRAALEQLARRLGVTDRITFTGRVPYEQVAQSYAQMDLFANPRVDERAARLITPLKPFEAMALGIPVLVSDLPALREIVDPPHRGVVAPAGDPVALAEVIETLADDPARRAALGAAGREWVRTERTWTANGPRYRAAYEAILGPLP
jgi:glycosyltransferase involved in cell wall biosynthesis